MKRSINTDLAKQIDDLRIKNEKLQDVIKDLEGEQIRPLEK